MEHPVEMFVRPSLHEASLVVAFEGWSDAGEAATGAVRYLSEAIRAVPLGQIDCEEFLDLTVQRPTIRLNDLRERTIEWPATRFDYGSHDTSHELVLAQGVEPHTHWRRYCDLFVSLVRRLGIRRVILLGAYVSDVVYSRPVAVTGFATSDELLEEVGVSHSSYEGPTGIGGVLAEELAAEGIEVLSLWAGLPHYISASPNSRGALALVQKVTGSLRVKIDDEPLRNEAASFEQKISNIVAADPELTEYVRELKRREFAQ